MGFTEGFGATPSTRGDVIDSLASLPPPPGTLLQPPPDASGFPYFWWAPPTATSQPGAPSSTHATAPASTAPAALHSSALPSPSTWTPDAPPPSLPLRLPLSARRMAIGPGPLGNPMPHTGAAAGARSGNRGTLNDEQARVTFTLDVSDSDNRLSRPLRSPPYRWGPPSPPAELSNVFGRSPSPSPESHTSPPPLAEVRQAPMSPLNQRSLEDRLLDLEQQMEEHKGDN